MAFCQTFRIKIRQFVNRINKYLRDNIDKALTITSNIKAAIENPFVVLITDIIPGEWDENIRKIAIMVLEKALIALDILKIESQGKLTNESLQWILKDLEKLSPKMRDTIYFKLASLITAMLNGKKMSQSEYDLAVQSLYTLKYKK